jgi:hypothetical protein
VAPVTRAELRAELQEFRLDSLSDQQKMQDEFTRKMEQSAKEIKADVWRRIGILGTMGTVIAFCFTILWKGIEQIEISPKDAAYLIVLTIPTIGWLVAAWYIPL